MLCVCLNMGGGGGGHTESLIEKEYTLCVSNFEGHTESLIEKEYTLCVV